MATRDSRPARRSTPVRRVGNVLHLSMPTRPTDSSAKPDQYRQDIWDSFPHLRKPAPMLTVHPYFETQE